jgi:hypothetical protein
MTVSDVTPAFELFDADWYRATYPEIGDLDPFEHFRTSGVAEGRDPNPLFSTRWYLARYRDVAGGGIEALEDFLTRGARLRRDPGPLFSTNWYFERVPALKTSQQNPLAHYIQHGFRERCDPSPVFDSSWYLATYPDAAGKGFDALLHFMHEGASLGYSPCAAFDTKWYLATYPEVAASGANPLLHYLLHGAARGFDPSPDFSTNDYMDLHPELMVSGDNPLVDFLRLERTRTVSQQDRFGSQYRRPSQAAIADARAVIAGLSLIEPDLLALPHDLGSLHVPAIKPGRPEQAWRSFYLSLSERPQTVILVDSIDTTAALAEVIDDTSGLLVIETDFATVSVAGTLPFGTQWRAFSEFEPDLTGEERLRLTIAAINGLQPATILVWGSRSGWEMLARHGKALRLNTAVMAVDKCVEQLDPETMMQTYWRTSFHVLSAVFSHDPGALRDLAQKVGVSSKDRDKIGPSGKLATIPPNAGMR